MSRAFVKETEDTGAADTLPDRPISAHANLVTPDGMAQIEAALARLQAERSAVQDDPGALARIDRDLRYWTSRHATAQVVTPPQRPKDVQFGATVTIRRPDGKRQAFRIVGEDEADPAHGTLSYVSPVARALIGGKVGDVVRAGTSDAEIVAIA